MKLSICIPVFEAPYWVKKGQGTSGPNKRHTNLERVTEPAEMHSHKLFAYLIDFDQKFVMLHCVLPITFGQCNVSGRPSRNWYIRSCIIQSMISPLSPLTYINRSNINKKYLIWSGNICYPSIDVRTVIHANQLYEEESSAKYTMHISANKSV